MAITIDYITNEILVPKADTVFIGTDPISGRELRSLDMDDFWQALADIQDNQGDVWAPTAFINTPPQDLGSVVLGRSVIIQAPYFVTFENGTYSVNLTGGNTNIATRTTVNSVQVIPNNSAGLIQVSSGSGLSAEQANQLAAIFAKLPVDGNEISSDQQVADADGGNAVWTEQEKEEALQYVKNASDNATEANLKL